MRSRFRYSRSRSCVIWIQPAQNEVPPARVLGVIYQDLPQKRLLKGLTGAGFQMKKKGAVLISVRDSDKQEAIRIGERFEALGFDIYATSGTANVLNRHMVATNSIRNVDEPSPNIIDLIESGKIDYVVATSVKGRHPELGSVHIRRTAVERAIPCLTSMDTVSALLRCLEGDIKIENCEMVDINTI